MRRYRFGLPKKLAFGDLFRQRLKKCLRPGAQTPRPPGKAGRYESTLEDLRALQTSGKGFVKSPRRSRLFWGLVLVVLLLLAGACARAQEQVQALFINVGKADAALFFLDDQRFLVDTGTKDSYDQLACWKPTA